jgi:DNA-binding MarR family transcriptional regulator
VTDRRQLQERQILDHLAGNRRVTQRALASDLGIALGLTNLLMRRLVRKGWVRIRPVSARRMMYLITPAGLTAKADLTRQYFLDSLDFYRETRERMRERLGAISARLEAAGEPSPRRVAFYGAGDVAEVAYVCLAEAGLELVGVVDDGVPAPFFHSRAHPASALAGETLAGETFAGLIVMPLCDEPRVRASLAERDVPPASVFWL